jgi:hypothetical protein
MRNIKQAGVHCAVVAALVAALVPAGRAQNLRPTRSEWRDLETWGRYIEASRETEQGLGLMVNGPQGALGIAFTGRLSVRDATAPAPEVTMQISAGPASNPGVMRRLTAVLRVDEKLDRPMEIDLSPRLVVDDPTPAAIFANAVGTLRPAEFARLCNAETLTGEAFGFELSFRPDHIAAIRELGERLHIVQPRTNSGAPIGAAPPMR